MNFDLDSTIFIAFLLATILLGLYSSYGVKNIKEFAVGDRNFSTGTLVATIVATWISGEFFYSSIYETYDNGLYALWISLGDPIYLFCIGAFFAKRMGEFLGKLSIADAMGDLFGTRVRIITAITGIISMIGLIGIQLKLTGIIFEHAIGIPSTHGILIATVIVTLYSSLGGIKSVTFTDVIQFITFSVTIPIISYALLVSSENTNSISSSLTTNPLFDYAKVFDFSNEKSLKFLFLFLFFVVPGFDTVTFQRIAMAKNTKQIRQSFIIASIICLFLGGLLQWISILVLSINPSMSSDEVFKLLLMESSHTGLKGFVLAGIMAMIMSTVDSCINSASILVVHDFLKPLRITIYRNELVSARFLSLIIGIFSLFISLKEGGLIELLVISYTFYMPIVALPFIMATLGFRSSEKSVLLGMFAGFVTILMWDYVLQIEIGNAIPIGMLANLIVLMSSHYLLSQPGGWVGIKNYSEVLEARRERKRYLKNLWQNIKSFNLIEFLKNNYPRGDGLLSILGFFIMISVFTSAHTLPTEIQLEYSYLLSKSYPVCLVCSSLLISYPIWIPYWRERQWVGILWNFVTFFVLVSFSFLMVLISNFGEMQLMAFMINIVVIAALSKWKLSLLNILGGVGIVTVFYQHYYPITIGESSAAGSQFKILYLLLLISSSLVLFLKPRQEYHEITEEKNEHLLSRIEQKNQEIEEALALKAEFIRNVNHEYRTPITGVMSMAQALQGAYDSLTEEQKKQALNLIVTSSQRLKEYDDNLTTLARLNKPNSLLNKEVINLSELVHDRVKSCRKLYETSNNELEFNLEIKDGLAVNVDKLYIAQLLDNLIINAIKYCPKGTICIILQEIDDKIEMLVEDEGVGIPQNELLYIFEPFTVSSKTRTMAGGRGVGLAACKKIVEVHGGRIVAFSDGVKGATFRVVLPT